MGALRSPGPATTSVTVAARDLPAGHTLTPGDLVSADVLAESVPPARLIGSPEQLMDGTVVTAQRLDAGVPLTSSSILEGDPWALDPDHVAVAVRFADPALAALIGPQHELTLISATGSGAIDLTDSARLLVTIASPQGSGLMSSEIQTSPLVVMAVDADVATLVLDASAGGTLTAVMRSADNP